MIYTQKQTLAGEIFYFAKDKLVASVMSNEISKTRGYLVLYQFCFQL